MPRSPPQAVDTSVYSHSGTTPPEEPVVVVISELVSTSASTTSGIAADDTVGAGRRSQTSDRTRWVVQNLAVVLMTVAGLLLGSYAALDWVRYTRFVLSLIWY